jgi:PPK2 family polyphosphate:nucleotide phosphotransferase
MSVTTQLNAKCLVTPGRRVRLRDLDPADTLGLDFAVTAGTTLKKRAHRLLEDSRDVLERAQTLLWASNACSVLVILQGMDTAGKDGMVKHVMGGMNPSACEVHAFKVPSAEERSHNFLWRYWQHLPARGRIGIFNRSYYESVLVERVHAHQLIEPNLQAKRRGTAFWADRFEDINSFERHLTRNGTLVLKFFLHISKAEQKRRLLERLDDKSKHWKFSLADLKERGFWSDYAAAYESMLNSTSSEWAPWYAIPADHKYVARAAVASILASRIEALGLGFPEVDATGDRRLKSARRALLAQPTARRR